MVELEKKVRNKVANIKKKELDERLGISYITLWKWLNKNKYIPLEVFKILEEQYGVVFSENILYLQSYHNNKIVKIPKKLDEKLAKIIGAYIADGYLKDRRCAWLDNINSIHYDFVLREEYLSNVEAFCRWFNFCFEYNLKEIKRKNHYEIYVTNKIIFYFLTKVMNLKISPKTDVIDIPFYIKNSNKKIKLAVLKGIFMFDGSVERKTGYVTLVSKSKMLIEEVFDLLTDININPDYKSNKKDKYGRSRIIIRKKEKLFKSLTLFEIGTEKWNRLNNFFKDSKV